MHIFPPAWHVASIGTHRKTRFGSGMHEECGLVGGLTRLIGLQSQADTNDGISVLHAILELLLPFMHYMYSMSLMHYMCSMWTQYLRVRSPPMGSLL